MNKLQINPPEGYEIDQDKSDLSKGVVHFKKSKKVLSYKDVAEKLFSKSETWYWSTEINGLDYNEKGVNQYETPDNSPTEQQITSILALNKLCNVAKYLNGDWPEFREDDAYLHFLGINGEIDFDATPTCHHGVYFKTKKLAQRAIDIIHYETTPVRRSGFKNVLKSKELNFDDFIETYHSTMIENTGKKCKLFTYKILKLRNYG